MVAEDKCRPHHPFSDHCEHQGGTVKVKGSLRQNGLARQEWLGNLLGELARPLVVLIFSIRERD